LEIKESTLDKTRRDRDELWVTINSDKYKNFKSVEEEKLRQTQKMDQVNSELQSVLQTCESES
jgi:hypothetical protein